MFVRPEGLVDESVAEALWTGWGVRAAELEYLAVGFGSHHWVAVEQTGTRWFVTVDDLPERRRSAGDTVDVAERRLSDAFGLARRLRDDGLSFVVAPSPALDGSILHRLGSHFAVTLYPYVHGETPGWENFTDDHRGKVIAMLAVLHDVPPAARVVAGLELAHRDVLHATLDDIGTPWASGPYADRARSLLQSHAGAVAAVLARYDEMAAAAATKIDRVVITHGEPHGSNVLFGPAGDFLIDWDTATTSLPERDMWMLETGNGAATERYRAATGTTLDRATLETFRLLWDLSEIAEYVRVFRAPHVDNANTAESWNNFQTYAAVEERWSHLV